MLNTDAKKTLSKTNKKLSFIIGGIIGLILLASFALAGWYYFSRQEKDNKFNEFGHPFSVWGIANIFAEEKIADDLKHMNQLGIISFKAHSTLSWGLYQGKDPWSFADTTIAEAKKYGVEPIFTITPMKGIEDKNELPKTQVEMNDYKRYVRDVVTRYKDNVDTWEIVNELSAHWSDSWENYAELLMVTVPEIKSIQPNAKIVMPGPATDLFNSGNSDPEAVRIVLENLDPNTKWFDYIDPHFLGAGDPSSSGKKDRYLDMIEWTNYFKNVLNKFGYNDVGWFTEIKTCGGEGFSATEKEQAIDLIKKYIVGSALGYDQIHNNGQIMQKDMPRKWEQEYRLYDGLVYSPEFNNGLDSKKLAYYSTKKIIEKLEGFDKDKTKTIKQNENGTFLYKFTVDGKLIWVAWNDNSQETQATISDLNSKQVKIAGAVPKYETGEEVTDYNTAFETETKNVNNGEVTLILSPNPIFIEEE